LAFLEIEKIFPEANFIMMVRDPRSIVNSMKVVRKKFLSRGQRPPRFLRSIAASVQEVNRYLTSGLVAAEKSDKILLVYYEDLVANPRQQIERVCKHVGLTFQTRMLNIESSHFISSGTGVDNWYSPEDLKQPIQKTGVVSKGSSLAHAERILVERYTLDHPALARYQLNPHKPTLPERLMWRASLIRKLGLFLPRKTLD
jgi:hypothetical protein